MLRRPRDIARRSWDDCFFLYRESSAGAWFDHDRREFVTRSDDLVICRYNCPFRHRAPDELTTTRCGLLPRRLLDPHLPVSRSPRSLVLTGSQGVAGMVKTYLDAFAAQMDTLPDGQVGSIADALCRLLAVACGGEAGEQGEAIRAGADRGGQTLRRRASDGPGPHAGKSGPGAQDLGQTVCTSCSSRREPASPNTSYSRRLDECRAALMSPIGDRSVTDVAFAWGFNSLATFYRTFHEAFGMTPGALRAGAASPTFVPRRPGAASKDESRGRLCEERKGPASDPSPFWSILRGSCFARAPQDEGVVSLPIVPPDLVPRGAAKRPRRTVRAS